MTGKRHYRLSASPRGLIVAALSLVLAMLVLAGEVLPLDPFSLDIARSWEGPSLDHPCGRDGLGRDLLARVLIGTGTSFGIAAASFWLGLTLSFIMGGIAGWLGGWVDALLMRVSDLVMGVRDFALAMVIATVLGPSTSAIILILGIGWFPALARFIRALTLTQRTQSYVLAATALGGSPPYILFKHILPNIMGQVLVRVAAIAGPLIQAEVALSFLGIGVQDPAPSLGTLIRDGLIGLRDGPHLILTTTLIIFLVSLTFTLLADEVRDTLDPRHDGRKRSETHPPE